MSATGLDLKVTTDTFIGTVLFLAFSCVIFVIYGGRSIEGRLNLQPKC